MVFVFLESFHLLGARAGSLERAISVMAAVHIPQSTRREEGRLFEEQKKKAIIKKTLNQRMEALEQMLCLRLCNGPF